MTLQEKFKDKVLFIKDEQMFDEVTELLKGVGSEFWKEMYYYAAECSFINYLQIYADGKIWTTIKGKTDTELTYEQFKELLKD